VQLDAQSPMVVDRGRGLVLAVALLVALRSNGSG